MSATKNTKDELEPIDSETEELDDEEGDGEEDLDLDAIEPTTLWRALSQYTTDMVEDDDWVDPELLPTYAIVLSNLAQIVAKLTNEPYEAEEDQDDEDEDVS